MITNLWRLAILLLLAANLWMQWKVVRSTGSLSYDLYQIDSSTQAVVEAVQQNTQKANEIQSEIINLQRR